MYYKPGVAVFSQSRLLSTISISMKIIDIVIGQWGGGEACFRASVSKNGLSSMNQYIVS